MRIVVLVMIGAALAPGWALLRRLLGEGAWVGGCLSLGLLAGSLIAWMGVVEGLLAVVVVLAMAAWVTMLSRWWVRTAKV